MTLREIFAAILLTIGVAGFVITAAGLLVSRDVNDQIHFLAPGSLLGSTAIPAAVLVHEGFSQAGSKAILIAILLVISNPVLSHATARAARIRRKGRPGPGSDENIPFADDSK